MANERMGPAPAWIAKSGEPRPVTSYVGAVIFESDTKREYVFDGKEWHLRRVMDHPVFSETESLLADILIELRNVVFHLQQVTDINV